MPSKLRGVNPPGGPTRGRVGAGDRTPTALASGEAFLGGEYTAAEWEYIRAVDAWQKKHRVRYPAATDYLSILVGLGYSKGRCAVTVSECEQFDRTAEEYVGGLTEVQGFGADPTAAGVLDDVRRGALAGGVPGWVLTLMGPVILDMLQKFGPAAVQSIVDWLTARFGRR